MRAFREITPAELPAGYDGEIGEAYSNLIRYGIPVNRKNLRAYLQAKGALIRYFRGDGKSLAEVYGQKIQKPTIAGAILPDWILAFTTIVDLVAGGMTIADILFKNMKRKVDKQETKVQGAAIQTIHDVENLTIIVNQARKSAKRRRSSAARKKRSP